VNPRTRETPAHGQPPESKAHDAQLHEIQLHTMGTSCTRATDCSAMT
jgi:hypothetical protein